MWFDWSSLSLKASTRRGKKLGYFSSRPMRVQPLEAVIIAEPAHKLLRVRVASKCHERPVVVCVEQKTLRQTEKIIKLQNKPQIKII